MCSMKGTGFMYSLWGVNTAEKGGEKVMSKRMAFLLCFMAVLLFAVPALAGTGGTEFQEIYTTLTDWTTGYLGKALAAGIFLVGVAMGVVKQSLMGIVLGIGGAMAVNYTPNILDAVVTALI